MRISKESWIIAFIGIADLVTTLVWVHFHGAAEANPVFAKYLAMGFVWFALMKIVLLAGPIFLLEWARRSRPVFTRRASQFAIAAYVAMYCVGVAKLNPTLFRPQPASADVVLAQGHTPPNVYAPRANSLWMRWFQSKGSGDHDLKRISSSE